MYAGVRLGCRLARRLHRGGEARHRTPRAPAAPPTKPASDDAASAALELLQFGAFVLCVNNYVLTSTQCVGPSMLPTISSAGDIVLALPISLFSWSIAPRTGDVVIATSPTDPSQTVCKRVLATEGEKVEVKRVPGLPRTLPRELVVPEGTCWLQGDNIYDSTDSRYYGPVPLALLQSVVFFRVWPLSTAGFIPRKSVEEVAALYEPRLSRHASPSALHVDVRKEEHQLSKEEVVYACLRAKLELGAGERGIESSRRGGGSQLSEELATVVERAREQARSDGFDPAVTIAPLQRALASLFDSREDVG